MGLMEDVSAAMTKAMKAKESLRVTALRNVRAAFLTEMKKDGSETLPDEVCIAVLRRLEKQRKESIDAFESAGRKLSDTVKSTEPGPLKEHLKSIAAQLNHGLDEAWQIAKRGDEIDDAVRTLDPTALRSKLATAQERASEPPSPDEAAAITSIESQLASITRLQDQSKLASATCSSRAVKPRSRAAARTWSSASSTSRCSSPETR